MRVLFRSLVAGAELGGRLIGEVALAEAVRRHQGDVLRRADELLQLRIEGVVELLVLLAEGKAAVALHRLAGDLAERRGGFDAVVLGGHVGDRQRRQRGRVRSEEHTSELQSLMRISYAVFCLKKKKNNTTKDYW